MTERLRRLVCCVLGHDWRSVELLQPAVSLPITWPFHDRPPGRPDVVGCLCTPQCAGWKEHDRRCTIVLERPVTEAEWLRADTRNNRVGGLSCYDIEAVGKHK